MLTIEQIKAMTDQEVMVAFAEDAATIDGLDKPSCKRAAEIYRSYPEEEAHVMVMQELGHDYLLDPDLCRQMLIDFVEYNTGVKP
jgi:hypothetical protein